MSPSQPVGKHDADTKAVDILVVVEQALTIATEVLHVTLQGTGYGERPVQLNGTVVVVGV